MPPVPIDQHTTPRRNLNLTLDILLILDLKLQLVVILSLGLDLIYHTLASIPST
jgi:hypothetical protein